ncbi:MAG: hypothetical protein LBM75_00125, partial [Myxococcales bacterium]|nr:hypothetical protein [Myxococcales bacterium]
MKKILILFSIVFGWTCLAACGDDYGVKVGESASLLSIMGKSQTCAENAWALCVCNDGDWRFQNCQEGTWSTCDCAAT